MIRKKNNISYLHVDTRTTIKDKCFLSQYVFSIMILAFIAILLFAFQAPSLVQTIKCSQECSFGPTPIDVVPLACPITDFNTLCSVELRFDFIQHLVNGSFEPKNETQSFPELDIVIEFNSSRMSTYLDYNCVTDTCDQEFVRETLSPVMAEFNSTELLSILTDTFFTTNPDPQGVVCADKRCASNEFCKAFITRIISGTDTSVEIMRHPGCVPDLLYTGDFMLMQQNLMVNTAMEMYWVVCNQPLCDGNKTLLDALNLVTNTFKLPLNYSFSGITTTTEISTISTSSLPSVANPTVSVSWMRMKGTEIMAGFKLEWLFSLIFVPAYFILT